MCFIGVNLGRRSSKGRSEIEREVSSPGSGFSGVEEEKRRGEEICRDKGGRQLLQTFQNRPGSKTRGV